LWAGVITSPTNSSFIVDSAKDDEIKQAKAIVAMKKVPYDEG
jgi:hypothetical protein